MELNAVAKTIRTLLSTNVKYVVPRFQREYSWTKEEISELWNDIIFNITVEDGTILNQEYFIGSLVLIGEDRSTELQIVDGQQRLTTVTIILSAIVQTFLDLDKENLANAVYETYIEGKDGEFNPFFKLVNENPKPFLQQSIQHITKTENQPANKEERTLWDSYSFYYNKLKKEVISRDYPKWVEMNGTSDEKYLTLLKAIRDQILGFLKVIYITVSNEDDAYMIFETLNARGKNLTSVDLVKNEIFKNLRGVHPDDDAKRKWKNIQSNLAERSQKINIETFFRHYWLSRFNFVTESKIFKSFKKKQIEEAFTPLGLLNELEAESVVYNKIANPHETDWPNQDNKPAYYSINALSLFQISQIRSFLLSLLKQRENGIVAHADFISFLQNMEHFHFKYTAICSLKMNIFEGKYSRAARNLREANNAADSRVVLQELVAYYRTKEPDFATFNESFNKLKFTKRYTKDKKLIQYIFKKYENHLRRTNEVLPGLISLEHILSQSNRGVQNIGKMGNLLPLDKGLNEVAGEQPFPDKITVYGDSELLTVNEFVNDNGNLPDWLEQNINQRTDQIATTSYNNIWVIR